MAGKEIWKKVEGFSKYEVSTFGRVHNIVKDFILKPCVDKQTGYVVYTLFDDNGIPHRKSGHRLVAETFIPNPEGKRTVNHEDTDKTNKHLSNLSWATDSENMIHAFKHGLCENTIKAAKVQQEILSKRPRTQRQIESARENIIAVNKRPKTERQLETSRNNINSEYCRAMANEAHYDRHPPIKVVETGEVYRSQRELAEHLGVGESAICACLHGRRKHAGGYHFEYTDRYRKTSFLYDYQLDAVNRMHNGCILCGSVGSGKSRTALFYYFKENGGWIDKDDYTPMKTPQDLIIITTAKKRDSLEWLGELSKFLLYPDENGKTRYGNSIVVDSWNNIGKYVDRKDCFFLLDEQRLVSYGAWTKSFLTIAKKNDWILLSATPADTYSDYLPVFLANGYFQNKTEFNKEHIVFSRYTKYPKIDKYVNTRKLDRLVERTLVTMDYTHDIKKHNTDVYCEYDTMLYKSTIKNRWDYFKDEPIRDAGGLCYVLRKVVNSHESRQAKVLEIMEEHPRAIIFYSYDYERDILLNLAYGEDVEVAEWTGHKHQPVPNSKRWVYICQYNSACEGWENTETNCIIFYSQNYSYKIMTQAAGRVDRLNTPFDELFYYYLKSRSGIDLAISKALTEKRKFNEKKWVKWN